MTQAAASQSGVEVLFRTAPEVRVTQSGAEVLHKVLPGARVTQTGVEYLHRVQPSNSVSQSGVEVLFKALRCTTQLAQVWTITRLDGEVLRFTSLDRDLDFGGHTFRSCHSLSPSASEAVAEVGAVGSIELEGLLASGAVTLFDLHAGRFDGAQVDAWLVPWRGTETPRCLLRGTFGKVSYSPDGFRVDILGDGARLLQTPMIRLAQPDCWKIFGGADCGVDLGPLTVTGTVTAATGQRGFSDSARGEAAGYFSRGRVTFTSGDNSGVSAEIKSHEDGGVFTLWPRLPFRIEVGDSYSMTPGCTQLREADGGTNGCLGWANAINFGGFAKMPGSDAVRRTPDVKKTI